MDIIATACYNSTGKHAYILNQTQKNLCQSILEQNLKTIIVPAQANANYNRENTYRLLLFM